MNNPERRDQPQFYFALPRLVASQLGWNAARTERNWLEANIVGGFEHLIWYAFAAHALLHGMPAWEKIALLIPLVVCVWICWLLMIYLNSVLHSIAARFADYSAIFRTRARKACSSESSPPASRFT